MASSRTKPWQRVAIVGVGLIGGSIGLDLLRLGLAKEVVGIGRRAATMKVAKKIGAVTETTLDLARGVETADLVIVCTPVGRIVDDVLAAAKANRTGALITDAGSTKESIVRAIDSAAAQGELPDGVCFIGSHPMAGSEKNGPAAATERLFVDRTVIITPTQQTCAKAAAAVTKFWKALGANVVTLSPSQHDCAVAAISHLPHVAASALAGVTARGNLKLVGGGWEDTTRVAAGDPDLWQQILLDNRAAILDSLDRYSDKLAAFRKAIEQSDSKQLAALLTEAKQTRDALGS